MKTKKIEFVGKRVIVRSNEEEPLTLGTITGIEKNVLIILMEEDGKEYWCNNLVVPFYQQFYDMLQLMTYQEQYDFLCDLKLTLGR